MTKSDFKTVTGLFITLLGFGLLFTFNINEGTQADDYNVQYEKMERLKVSHVYEDNCIDLKNTDTDEITFYCEADFK